VGLTVGPGGPSARAPRTVRMGPADCPRVGLGPSARSTELHPILLRITDRPPGVRGLSARKRIFSKTFGQKTQILNKYQKTRRPSAPRTRTVRPTPETDFSYDFQRNPFTKRNHHSSKCIAC
jgi:hypothetical protein